ncbi:MAG: hypothetical protein IRY91_15535, partial [Gemmatimonadaceae bacterium]|nr:hypothetical protein [Gemmatimonadaceae bacterium]
MRVLFLAHSVPRHLGKEGGAAAGALLLRLAVALREEGVEVQIIAPAGRDAPGAEQLGGVQIERFRATRARVAPAARGAAAPPAGRGTWAPRRP